jgi:hypothetical protein
MRTHLKRMALAAATVVALAGAGRASAQTVWGTYDQPLEGRRFEAMRALAHYLDEAAQDALAGTVQARRRGTPADRRYITAVRDFARQAESFHTRMDDYSASQFDVTDEVDYLAARARRVNQLVRRGGAYQDTYDDWKRVIDSLGLMRRALNGEDVEVPAAHDEYGDYDRDYGYLGRGGNTDRGTVTTGRTDTGGTYPRNDTYGGTYPAGALTGTRLQQFRELAHQLDTYAKQTLAAAERSAPNNDRARSILADLRHFAEQARSLQDRSDANEVAPREISGTIDHLLEDARLVDRNMRDARAFSDAWDEWARTIGVLNRMASLMR